MGHTPWGCKELDTNKQLTRARTHTHIHTHTHTHTHTPSGDLPNPGIELVSLMSPALAGGLFTTSATWGAPIKIVLFPKLI